MDPHGSPHGENGRFEQILSQFLLKSLHIILDLRVPAIRPSNRGGEPKRSDKWFNLVIGDRPAAIDSLSFSIRSLMENMIIDIVLVQESPNPLFGYNSLMSDMVKETVIERWVVQHEHLRTMVPQVGDVSYKKTYKKSIILLRSVYSMLRLLPAYKGFRKLCSLSQNCDFDINYKVCSFGAPFSRAEEELMNKYSFTPIDTPQGRLSVSVMYRKDLSEFNLDASVSFPPEIIADYVGSPLTDPMRAFPSSSYSEKGFHATSFPTRARQGATSSPFQRPHSWSNGLQQENSLRRNQPLGGSPPLYHSPYEFSPSPTDTYSNRIPNQRFLGFQKEKSTDLFSPPFSQSPSPSPPTPLSGGYPVRSRMHTETPPMSIPHAMMGRSPRFLSPNLSDPNRNSLPPLSPRNVKYDRSYQESPSGIGSPRKSDVLKGGESSSGMAYLGQKMSRDAKEDSGRFSGLLSSSSSPRIGFSRSSSRLSFQDDFGDGDFSGPFIVDDIDPPDFQASRTSDGRNKPGDSSHSSSTPKKSQDAAVGALVHMLRTAPPLRQDSMCYTSQSLKSEVEGEIGAVSDFFRPRKASDALEELKTYKEMKVLLLSKSAQMATRKG